MSFENYFRLGQVFTLRLRSPVQAGEQVEEFRGVLLRREGQRLELRLAAAEGKDAAGLGEGESVELLSERFGLGLRLTGKSCGWGAPGVLCLESQEDLEIYYRRLYRRAELSLWLGLRRAEVGTAPLHDQWNEALARRAAAADPTGGTAVARYPVNLSAGGIRLGLAEPVNLQEPCLLFLMLEDTLPAVCALGEVVWLKPGETPEVRVCGLRFAGILAEDQQRIDRFVTAYCRTHQPEEGKSSG